MLRILSLALVGFLAYRAGQRNIFDVTKKYKIAKSNLLSSGTSVQEFLKLDNGNVSFVPETEATALTYNQAIKAVEFLNMLSINQLPFRITIQEMLPNG